MRRKERGVTVCTVLHQIPTCRRQCTTSTFGLTYVAWCLAWVTLIHKYETNIYLVWRLIIESPCHTHLGMIERETIKLGGFVYV